MSLLDYLDNPAVQGLLAAGFGGLTSRTVAGGIGRGGLLGLTAYNNAQNNIADRQQQAKRDRLFDLQLSQHQQAQEAAKVASQQAALRRNYLAGSGQVTSPVVGAAPNKFDPVKWVSLGGAPEEAKVLSDMGNWGKPKIKDYKEVRNADGSVTVTGFDEYGDAKNTGASPFKAPEIRDFGGYVGGIDPITGKVSNYGAKTMSAAERDASARGWAGVNQATQSVTYQQDADGNIVALPNRVAPGSAIRATPVIAPGNGMQPMQGKASATEDQSKAAGWLAQARNAYGNMQKAIETNPSAMKPGVGDLIPGGFGRPLMSPERQQFNQGASSLGEAILRAATGAGVNADEAAQKQAELTPQWGDSPAVIKQKLDAIPMYLRSLEMRAGPAGRQVPHNAATAPASADGWSIRPKGQ